MFTIPNGTSNADPQAQVDAIDWQILEQGVRGDGVATTADLAVAQRGAGANMSVDVAAGVAAIGSTTTATVAAANLVVGANSSGNPRFDLVSVNTSGVLSVTAGTAAVAPVFPAIPASSLVLAAVYVPTGASSITTARIVDKRVLRSAPAWTSVTVTSNHTAVDREFCKVDCTAANVTVLVPITANTQVIVQREDDALSGHTLTVQPVSGTIDGGASVALAEQYRGVWVMGDGTNVAIVGERKPFGSPGRLGGPVADGVSTRVLRADAVFDTKMLRNVQSGTSYTLVLTDADNKVVECDNASPVTLTVPPAASVAWQDGTTIEWYQKGAGQVTVTAGAGVTLRARNGAKSGGQFASGGLRYRGSDEWIVSGDTTT